MNKPFYADALGFLALPGDPIRELSPNLKLNLVHLTSAPPWCKTMEETLGVHRYFRSQVESQPQLRLVTNRSELDQAIAEGKTAIVLGLQNLPDDANPKSIRTLYEEGVRIVSLAYQDENRFGSGWINAGIALKPAGEKILDACAEICIIVDLSHNGHTMTRHILAELTIRNAAGKRLFPVIASHGGCYAVYPHMRNLPDDVLHGIARYRGIVGIATLTFILHQTDNDIAAFGEHLRHAIRVCGQDAVTIGSDGTYLEVIEEELREKFDFMKEKLDPSGVHNARFPDQPIELYCGNRMEVMRKAYPISDGVVGLNFLNFLRRTLP